MELPIRLSSARKMLSNYLQELNGYTSLDFESQKSQLINDLERVLDKVTKIADQMLSDLGFTGGNVQAKEKQLSDALLALQSETSYLNGNELNDFFIRALAHAAPYSLDLQQQYEALLMQLAQEYGVASIEEVPDKKMAELLLEVAGYDLDNFAVGQIGNKRTYMGRGYKNGKATGGATIAVDITDQISKLNKSLRENKKFQAALQNIALPVNQNNTTLSIDVNEDNIYGLLRTSKTARQMQSTITELMQRDPTLEAKVKDFLEQKLMNAYSGSHKSEYKWAVQTVLSQAKTVDIFAGANAPKKITGLFGEIQGLFYLKVIAPKGARSKWTATQFQNGAQPHADLLLSMAGKQYGIQVKNSSYSQVEQEVNFETFSTKAAQHIQSGQYNFDFSKQLSKDFLTDLSFNETIFQAAGGILAMQQFNIPYIWDRESDHAKKADISQVPVFADTYSQIQEAAETAQRALAGYLGAMMYMQYKPKQGINANTLYIVHGNLILTSATILLQVINDLKENIRNWKFEMKSVYNKQRDFTIVDFLNAGGVHKEDTWEYELSSSFTFK